MIRPSTVLLALSFVGLPGARVDAQGTASPVLHVHAGARDTSLSAADLRSLARHQLKVAAEDSGDSVTVSGYALWDVVQKAGVPFPEASGRQRAASYVRLVGAECQTAFFALVELDPGFSRKTVLLGDQRNGRPLDAVEGPWRVFAPDDLRHARWIRGLVRIDVGTLPP